MELSSLNRRLKLTQLVLEASVLLRKRSGPTLALRKGKEHFHVLAIMQPSANIKSLYHACITACATESPFPSPRRLTSNRPRRLDSSSTIGRLLVISTKLERLLILKKTMIIKVNKVCTCLN